MSENSIKDDSRAEDEIYPVEPRYHPIHKIPRKIYDFLASARLALTLLVAILACCLCGVTVWRGERAWAVIFSSLWFNSLLVLLVVNVACCFFGRIWGRRVTLVSFGMILFHLSFVAMLAGIVYNSLFYFRGSIRLTEGETLPSGDPKSYDHFEKGRFFKFSRLKGNTELISFNPHYKLGGEDKRAAYEVAVGEGFTRQQGIIYITHKLTHKGVDYFNEKEGFSLLVILANSQGQEIYGGHLPLQSITQKDRSYLNTTGYKDAGVAVPAPVSFPPPPDKALFALQVSYQPVKSDERNGEVNFQVSAPKATEGTMPGQPFASGKVHVGKAFAAADHLLSVKEVRYWVGMTVRYEPGKPVVLTSLWVALAGMILTTAGRMMRKKGLRNENIAR